MSLTWGFYSRQIVSALLVLVTVSELLFMMLSHKMRKNSCSENFPMNHNLSTMGVIQ